MHPIKHFYFLLICILMSMLLFACGSKGDLYQVAEPEAAKKITVDESQHSDEETQKKQL